MLIRNLIAGFLGLVLLLDAGCGAVNGLPVSNSGSVSAADVVHATPVPTPAVPRTAIQVKCGQLADSPLDAQKYGYGVALQSINARDAVMTCQSAASVPDYGAQYQFDYGRALLASGRYADAAKQFAAAAEAGNGLAAFTLAGLYEGGIGLKKDLEQASHWYQVAGSDGYADGFAAVGALYLLRVDPDYAKAVKWFAAASQDGSTMGAALMGWAYETGNGASKDPARAAALYTDAGTPSISGFVRASPWVVDAIFRLGLLEFRGNGVAKDPNAAVKWFEKAASVDHALSKTAMGYAYLTGAGYQQQYGYPSVLFRQAAEQGEPYAEYNLGLLYDAGLGVKTGRSRARAMYQAAVDSGISEIADKARAHLDRPVPANTDPGSLDFLEPTAQPAVTVAIARIKYIAEHPAPTPGPQARVHTEGQLLRLLLSVAVLNRPEVRSGSPQPATRVGLLPLLASRVPCSGALPARHSLYSPK